MVDSKRDGRQRSEVCRAGAVRLVHVSSPRYEVLEAAASGGCLEKAPVFA